MNRILRETTIHDAEPFSDARHNIYLLNSGSDFVETMIQWRAGKVESPAHAEFVFATPPGFDGKGRVIAYACGEVVHHDHDTKKPLDVPRIDLQLVGVDQNFQGMGFGRVASAKVIETLYAHAGMPKIEVRSIDPIGTYASAMRRSCGFVPIPGSAHMNLMVCPDELTRVMGWSLRLRPGIVITRPVTIKEFDMGVDLSRGKHPGVAFG